MRNAAHFGGPHTSYDDHVYAPTAKAALEQLDEQYELWTAGVRALGEEGLTEPPGPSRDRTPTHPWLSSSCTSTAR